MTTPEKSSHHLFLSWLILISLVIFSGVLAGYEGILSTLYSSDKSKISWVITVLFLLICAHCARRTFFVSGQLNATRQAQRLLLAGGGNVRLGAAGLVIDSHPLPANSALADYWRDLLHSRRRSSVEPEAAGSRNELLEVYESRLKKPNELGWFTADIMIRLGLLGTVIGFVLMLGSVVNVTDFDVNTMQSILRKMSAGMGTALYTTFAGLVASIFTGIQYYLLDQGADEVIEATKHMTQVYLLPGIREQ